MGAVHAKEAEVQKDSVVSLGTIGAQVVKVHVDGIQRTNESLVLKNVQSIFKVKHFEELVLESQLVRSRLQGLGCFSDIDIHIDTPQNGNSKSDYEVTFSVTELKRVAGSVNTMVGNNEGSLMVGLKLPNLVGKGERFQIDYTHGTKKTSQFNATLSKPLHDFKSHGVAPTISTTAFQQMGEFPWSGYKELNRGVLFDLAFLSAPQVAHNLQYEACWRNLTCLDKSTSFAVREHCGPSLKSSLRHILCVDRRDNPVFPSEGSLFKLSQEYAGLGGDIGFFKNELEVQANVPLPSLEDFVLQGTFQCGHIKRMSSNDLSKTMTVADRFYLGGPLNVRGFEMRGLGPNVDANALGGLTYFASGLHLYTPLPFLTSKTTRGFSDLFRTHLWANAGNLITDCRSIDEAAQNFRLTCGLGLALKIGGIARIELNYCIPLRLQRSDRPVPGVQFGIGVHFL